jgi:hypothetical protein
VYLRFVYIYGSQISLTANFVNSFPSFIAIIFPNMSSSKYHCSNMVPAEGWCQDPEGCDGSRDQKVIHHYTIGNGERIRCPFWLCKTRK